MLVMSSGWVYAGSTAQNVMYRGGLDVASEDGAVPSKVEAQSGKVSKALWLAICETVVGRRRKATEGLAMTAASLSASRVVARDARPPSKRRQESDAAPHFPDAGIV